MCIRDSVGMERVNPSEFFIGNFSDFYDIDYGSFLDSLDYG